MAEAYLSSIGIADTISTRTLLVWCCTNWLPQLEVRASTFSAKSVMDQQQSSWTSGRGFGNHSGSGWWVDPWKKPSPAVSQGLNGTDATGCTRVRWRRSLAGMTSSCDMTTKSSQVIYTSGILGLSHLRNRAQYAGRTPQLFSRMATCNVIPPQEVTRQCAYNVTLRCVRGTTVAVEKW